MVDASCCINLLNGGALTAVLGLSTRAFLIGPLVLSECAGDRPRFEELIENGILELSDEERISGKLYVAFLERYRLGAGETECLTIAKDCECAVASDDRAARRAIAKEIGKEKLTGSIGLLKEAVSSGSMTPLEAMACYEQMRAHGAFLPDIELQYFAGK